MLSPAWAYRHIFLNDSLGDIVGPNYFTIVYVAYLTKYDN